MKYGRTQSPNFSLPIPIYPQHAPLPTYLFIGISLNLVRAIHKRVEWSSSRAWEAQQWPRPPQQVPTANSSLVRDRVRTLSTPSVRVFLVGLFLHRSCAGDRSLCEILSQSHYVQKTTFLQRSSLSYGSQILPFLKRFIYFYFINVRMLPVCVCAPLSYNAHGGQKTTSGHLGTVSIHLGAGNRTQALWESAVGAHNHRAIPPARTSCLLSASSSMVSPVKVVSIAVLLEPSAQPPLLNSAPYELHSMVSNGGTFPFQLLLPFGQLVHCLYFL